VSERSGESPLALQGETEENNQTVNSAGAHFRAHVRGLKSTLDSRIIPLIMPTKATVNAPTIAAATVKCVNTHRNGNRKAVTAR